MAAIMIIILALLSGGAFAQQNVLLIVADDLGVDYISAYGEGADFAPTPVLDSLAGAGLVFTNAWTNPICSPSRANMMTGKYAFRTGIGDAIQGGTDPYLDTSEYTLPKAVHDQLGASTAMFGKWHLGHAHQAQRRNPNACGFDHYSGSLEGQLSSYTIWTKTVNGVNESVLNQYATTVNVNDAIAWIGQQSSNWLVFMTFNAPHVPFHKPPNNLHSFDYLSGTPTNIANNPIPYFKASVEAMDTEIGRLLDYLEFIGQLDSTNIIFIGDNGTDGAVVQSPFSGSRAKGTIYDGGVRVPLLVSGPAVSDPGRFSDNLVNSTDLYPTILEIMGGDTQSLPAGSSPDGKSFSPALLNQDEAGDQRDWIYGDLFKDPPSGYDGKAIRDEEYKLIKFDNGNTAFYHISADPFESSPLNLNSLGTVAQAHYNFLCDELSTLIGTNMCGIPLWAGESELQIIRIYPNPSDRYILMGSMLSGSSDGMNVDVVDAAGRLVFTGDYHDLNGRVDVSGLASGTYRLMIRDDVGYVAAGSFVVQH